MLETEHSKQTSESSWWPKHSAWIKSGLYVGYWTPQCEAWFQERLQMIREQHPDGRPLRATAWNKKIRLNHDTRWLVEANEMAARKYFGGQYGL
jgi:hypothetical protein